MVIAWCNACMVHNPVAQPTTRPTTALTNDDVDALGAAAKWPRSGGKLIRRDIDSTEEGERERVEIASEAEGLAALAPLVRPWLHLGWCVQLLLTTDGGGSVEGQRMAGLWRTGCGRYWIHASPTQTGPGPVTLRPPLSSPPSANHGRLEKDEGRRTRAFPLSACACVYQDQTPLSDRRENLVLAQQGARVFYLDLSAMLQAVSCFNLTSGPIITSNRRRPRRATELCLPWCFEWEWQLCAMIGELAHRAITNTIQPYSRSRRSASSRNSHPASVTHTPQSNYKA
ncbi:hypothetical protein O1611_g4579 [Lasiodiplodia mahajangana]|uniref:Uncharacterized protein n=1 Tax=Lasiodiplodia mahajangana TaxID=1108764 RepID=A0ACC2JNH2_9PEZI|nr:hypothetical protein O1611_g4579 [Lasiodiplodia mahajangana]